MDRKVKVFISLGILVFLVLAFYFASKTITAVTGKSILGWLVKENVKSGNLDEFAQCLSEKGARMYGRNTCPHCINQKALFGDSFNYIDYIECSSSPEQCAGLEGVPAWKIKEETIYGVQSLEKLAELTNCKLNK